MDVQTDREPEQNRFIRSDQYSFIRRGIPSLAFKFGYEFGSPEEKIRRDWVRDRYHKPIGRPEPAGRHRRRRAFQSRDRERCCSASPTIPPGRSGTRTASSNGSPSEPAHRATEFAPDARHVPYRRAALRFHHPRLLLRHGPPLETRPPSRRAALPPTRSSSISLPAPAIFRSSSPRAIPARGRSRSILPSACSNSPARPGSPTPSAPMPASSRFPTRAFDGVFIGYGLRNFPNLDQAIREIRRVTRPGGVLVSLDFFLPANRDPADSLRGLSLCARRILGLRPHARPRVYTYIPDSLRAFVTVDEFSTRLRQAGYREVESRPFILGGIALHWAK